MRSLNLDQLETLQAIAETQSFSAAARRLNLSQPAVSTQMRELEARFGVSLLERLGKKTLPTAAGRDLHGACATHRAGDGGGHGAGAAAPRRLARARTPRHQHDRAEFPSSAGAAPAAQRAPVYRACGNQRHHRRGPGANRSATSSMPASSICRSRIMRSRWCRCAKSRWLRSFRRMRTASRCMRRRNRSLQQSLIFERPHAQVNQLILAWFAAAGFAPRPAMELDNLASAARMVGVGLGVSIVPERVAADAQAQFGVAGAVIDARAVADARLCAAPRQARRARAAASCARRLTARWRDERAAAPVDTAPAPRRRRHRRPRTEARDAQSQPRSAQGAGNRRGAAQLHGGGATARAVAARRLHAGERARAAARPAPDRAGRQEGLRDRGRTGSDRACAPHRRRGGGGRHHDAAPPRGISRARAGGRAAGHPELHPASRRIVPFQRAYPNIEVVLRTGTTPDTGPAAGRERARSRARHASGRRQGDRGRSAAPAPAARGLSRIDARISPTKSRRPR